MLIPREMAPNNAVPVINLYDPMPAGSAVALYTNILATGPKKTEKVKISKYLKRYMKKNRDYLRET